MVKISSASAQQVLRKTCGVIVVHKGDAGGPKTSVIVDHKGFKQDFEDDHFLTQSHNIFMKIRSRAREELHMDYLKNLQIQPALVYDSRYDPELMLDNFDQEAFEHKIIPPANTKAELRGFVRRYNEAVALDADSVERPFILVDALFSFFYYLRQHPTALALPVELDVNEAVPMSQALSSLKEHLTISLPAGQTDLYVPLLIQVHPNGLVKVHDDVSYFCAKSLDPFAIIGSHTYEPDVSKVPLEKLKKGAKVGIPKLVEGLSEQLDEEITTAMGICVQRVRLLLVKPEQRMQAQEREFRNHGGYPGFLEEDSGYALPKSSMGGMGKILGVGKLEDCIMRLAMHVQQKTGRPLLECLYFSSGRLCRMNSNKKIVAAEDGFLLRDK